MREKKNKESIINVRSDEVPPPSSKHGKLFFF